MQNQKKEDFINKLRDQFIGKFSYNGYEVTGVDWGSSSASVVFTLKAEEGKKKIELQGVFDIYVEHTKNKKRRIRV